jgi:hypothetical protein
MAASPVGSSSASMRRHVSLRPADDRHETQHVPHSAGSGFANVSRYAQGTTARNIVGYVDDALRYGTVTRTGQARTWSSTISAG